MGGKLDVESEVGVGWLKVKELICEDKENVTDSNLDSDIIFIIDDIDRLKKIISKVDSKQAPIVFTTILAKHGKIADFVEKLQKEIENSTYKKKKKKKKTSSISPTINDPSNKSDSDSSLLSVAPPLRFCFNRSITLPNLHLSSENKEPKFLPIPKSTFLLTPSTSPCATPTTMSTSLPNMSESLNINPPSLNELKKSKSANSLSCNLGPKVLVVEDNAVNRTILTTFLKKRGIRFDEAENGAIGVEKFKKALEDDDGEYPNRKGFDIVLMDIQMNV
ncbi:unnamed protein product [Rhizophagus irregularis]|nr:unnamed protein product [Rhizophagus irregularis]